MTVAQLLLALVLWPLLKTQANQSKVTYSDTLAACLLRPYGMTIAEKAQRLLARMPKLQERMAGKSNPLEKFVACNIKGFWHAGGCEPQRLSLHTIFIRRRTPLAWQSNMISREQATG